MGLLTYFFLRTSVLILVKKISNASSNKCDSRLAVQFNGDFILADCKFPLIRNDPFKTIPHKKDDLNFTKHVIFILLSYCYLNVVTLSVPLTMSILQYV